MRNRLKLTIIIIVLFLFFYPIYDWYLKGFSFYEYWTVEEYNPKNLSPLDLEVYHYIYLYPHEFTPEKCAEYLKKKGIDADPEMILESEKRLEKMNLFEKRLIHHPAYIFLSMIVILPLIWIIFKY
ncbi:MAG: hypothetical protein ACE5K4_05440 [Candidatus Hydrothermarchaeota archaeon]